MLWTVCGGHAPQQQELRQRPRLPRARSGRYYIGSEGGRERGRERGQITEVERGGGREGWGEEGEGEGRTNE